MAVSLRAGMAVSKVVGFFFWLAVTTFVAGLLIAGWWWLALAIFGGALLIRGWTEYAEPRSDLPKVL